MRERPSSPVVDPELVVAGASEGCHILIELLTEKTVKFETQLANSTPHIAEILLRHDIQ